MNRRFWAPLLLVFVGLSFLPQAAAAHQEPYSWVDVRIAPDGWGGRVTAHVDDLAGAIGLANSDSLGHPASPVLPAAKVERALEQLLRLEADGAPVLVRWSGITVVPERRAVAFDFRAGERPPSVVLLRGPLFRADPSHETYFNVYVNGYLRHQGLLDAGHVESRYVTGIEPRRIEIARRFVAEGMHHIFIGPDHIAFVVALLLLGGDLARLLGIVTSFTLAHSVTLALAALGLVTPPARLVEPAIALSIVFVGVGNLRGGEGKRDRRALVAGCFGLVHGFGFAGVLRELGLPRDALAVSLLSFNAGVEIGQACIVLAVAPIVTLLAARRPALALRVVQLGSLLVVAAGAWWFVRRAFPS